MKISNVLVPKKQSRKKRFILLGLLFTGILSATLIIVTYFGFFTGTNFLLLDQELGARGIHITKYKDLSNRGSKIELAPIGEDGLSETDNRDIDFDSHNHFEGNYQFGSYTQEIDKVSHNYGVYQFYLINESDKLASSEYTLNVSYVIEFTRVTNNLSDALGYRVFIDDYEDEVATPEYDSGIILKDDRNSFPTIEEFKPKEVKRVTIYFWLEGDLTHNYMVNGTIRLRIRFTLGELEGEV